MSWVLLALIAAVLFAIVNILDRHILTHDVRDPILACHISDVGAIVIILILVAITGDIRLPFPVMFAAVGAGMIFSIGNFFYYTAIKRIEASRMASYLALKPLAVAVLAFIFLGESFSIMTYAGILLIILGSLLISLKHIKNHFLWRDGVMLGIIPPLFYATGDVILKPALDSSFFAVLFYLVIGIALVSGSIFFIRRPNVRSVHPEGLRNLILSGSLSVIASLLYFSAIQQGPVTLVGALEQTKTLFVFVLVAILSTFFPSVIKEKLTKSILIQKLIAILFIVAGSFLVI